MITVAEVLAAVYGGGFVVMAMKLAELHAEKLGEFTPVQQVLVLVISLLWPIAVIVKAILHSADLEVQ